MAKEKPDDVSIGKFGVDKEAAGHRLRGRGQRSDSPNAACVTTGSGPLQTR